MCDEPRRCSSPQLKATRRSDHTDAKSCAEEHLNNPNIADEVLVKETSVGHARDEVIPRRWSDEHKQSVSKQKQTVERYHYKYQYRNDPILFCYLHDL